MKRKSSTYRPNSPAPALPGAPDADAISSLSVVRQVASNNSLFSICLSFFFFAFNFFSLKYHHQEINIDFAYTIATRFCFIFQQQKRVSPQNSILYTLFWSLFFLNTPFLKQFRHFTTNCNICEVLGLLTKCCTVRTICPCLTCCIIRPLRLRRHRP